MTTTEKIDSQNLNREKGDIKRWTASRKLEVVLRHLRGENLDSLSREVGVAASQIEDWYRTVLQGGENSLKSRVGDALLLELDTAKKRIGELSMENELLKERSRRMGVFHGGKRKK